MPRAIISIGRNHIFYNTFDGLLKMYNITYNIVTPYLTQTFDQVEVSNRKTKGVLEHTLQLLVKDWAIKLNDSLRAYIITCKTHIGMSLTS